MTRWLVTGAAGMLGQDVVTALSEAGEQVTARRRSELDITDPTAVSAAVAGYDVVVNAAAWTNVDAAEADPDGAALANVTGPTVLAEAIAGTDARLVNISTDYVFGGSGAGTPYAEQAGTDPVNVYGRTKADGDAAVLARLPDRAYVVRTSWLYGAGGANFVTTMARLSTERDGLSVVDDQRGQPTWTRDVAEQVLALVRADAPAGAYHASSTGDTTWCGLARAVFEELGLDPERVQPVTTDQFPRPAPRPEYTVLGHEGWERAGIAPIRPWREALHEAAPSVLAAWLPAGGRSA